MSSTLRLLSPLLRGALALAILVLAARTASATEPAIVRVRLHPREEAHAPITFVDIAVRGTEAPIRLLRRVEGTCTVASSDVAPALVRIECGPDVRFEVTRDRQDVVVRRNAPPDSDAGTTDGWMVIARAVLPPHADLRLEPSDS